MPMLPKKAWAFCMPDAVENNHRQLFEEKKSHFFVHSKVTFGTDNDISKRRLEKKNRAAKN